MNIAMGRSAVCAATRLENVSGATSTEPATHARVRLTSRAPQTVATLIGNAMNVKSLSDARSSSHRDLRLNLSRTYSKRTTGMVELRHVRGSTGLGGQQYTENAVSATLTTRF